MQMLLITIVGPQRSVDLQVPGELPISDLLPTLLEIGGLPTETFWWAVSYENRLLMDDRSLLQSDVPDGAVLMLQDKVGKTVQLEPVEHNKTFTPASVTPGPGTGGIGVTWNTDGLLSES